MLILQNDRRISYFKRYKMEIGLFEAPPLPRLPEGFVFQSWSDNLIDVHAEVTYWSFFEEIDARVFPSLGNREGCRCLMLEIRQRHGFLPGATWLLQSPQGYCGSIQAVRENSGVGAIQNLGVTAPNRGQGLGEALLLQALHGFRRAGLGKAVLEVTAENETAIRLYRRLGFRKRKTVYKPVEIAITST